MYLRPVRKCGASRSTCNHGIDTATAIFFPNCHLGDVNRYHGCQEAVTDALSKHQSALIVSMRAHAWGFSESMLTYDQHPASNQLAIAKTRSRHNRAQDLCDATSNNPQSPSHHHTSNADDDTAQPRRQKEHRCDHGNCGDAWVLVFVRSGIRQNFERRFYAPPWHSGMTESRGLLPERLHPSQR